MIVQIPFDSDYPLDKTVHDLIDIQFPSIQLHIPDPAGVRGAAEPQLQGDGPPLHLLERLHPRPARHQVAGGDISVNLSWKRSSQIFPMPTLLVPAFSTMRRT